MSETEAAPTLTLNDLVRAARSEGGSSDEEETPVPSFDLAAALGYRPDAPVEGAAPVPAPPRAAEPFDLARALGYEPGPKPAAAPSARTAPAHEDPPAPAPSFSEKRQDPVSLSIRGRYADIGVQVPARFPKPRPPAPEPAPKPAPEAVTASLGANADEPAGQLALRYSGGGGEALLLLLQGSGRLAEGVASVGIELVDDPRPAAPEPAGASMLLAPAVPMSRSPLAAPVQRVSAFSPSAAQTPPKARLKGAAMLAFAVALLALAVACLVVALGGVDPAAFMLL